MVVLNDLAVQVLTELPKDDMLVAPWSGSAKPERKDSLALQETRHRGQLPSLRHTAASWLAMNGRDL